MGKVQAMWTTLQSHTVQARPSFRQGNPSFRMRGKGRFHFIIMVGGEDLKVEVYLHKLDGGDSLIHTDPTHSLINVTQP